MLGEGGRDRSVRGIEFEGKEKKGSQKWKEWKEREERLEWEGRLEVGREL